MVTTWSQNTDNKHHVMEHKIPVEWSSQIAPFHKGACHSQFSSNILYKTISYLNLITLITNSDFHTFLKCHRNTNKSYDQSLLAI